MSQLTCDIGRLWMTDTLERVPETTTTPKRTQQEYLVVDDRYEDSMVMFVCGSKGYR
jgi:hypothetical protein